MTTPYFLDEPSPERFEAVIQSISDGVMTVDSDWRITCFNKAAERISGISRKEAMGRHCYEVLKSNLCRDTCAMRYTIETGRPVVNLAVYLVHREGIEVPVSISTAIFKDKDGNLQGGVVTFRDLRQVEEFRKEIKKNYSYGDIISKSNNVKKILGVLPTIAESDSTVLITGESGTGKEIFARAIHASSGRKKMPFVAVNCGGFPETLIESELFGHEAGAFTGATRARQGRFARAQGGTLFLDEIGDLPLPLQVKLLRVLQEKVYEPLGGTRSLSTNARIITATNRDLHKMVADGTFRQDLFYRINVINLEIPPLRERLEDVPLLVDHFITRFSALQNKDIEAISHDALDVLMNYDYPGNVRELENIIEHGCVLCPGGLIHVKHLPDSLRPTLDSFVRADTFEEMERQFIIFMLKKNKWHRLATARDMGIHKTTLFRKIKKLDIRLPDLDGRNQPKDGVA